MAAEQKQRTTLWASSSITTVPFRSKLWALRL